MSNKVTTDSTSTYKKRDMEHSAHALIAASSIINASADQYAHTGVLSVGAIIHAGNVIDQVIERLGLAELVAGEGHLPF